MNYAQTARDYEASKSCGGTYPCEPKNQPPSSEKKPSEVDSAIRAIIPTLNLLESVVAELYGKLEPVLDNRAKDEKKPTASYPMPDASCELTAAINERHYRVVCVVDRLQNLISDIRL